MNILRLERDEILALEPERVKFRLSKDEFIHIAKTLGAFWAYDYSALLHGKPGIHALLKSGRHSDGFFVSKVLLAWDNIRRIMGEQVVMAIHEARIPAADYVAGVPDGASALGKDIAEATGAREARLTKIDGRISFETRLGAGDSILLVEDVCTRGTGFIEAVASIKEKRSGAHILRFAPVIINRGGLKAIVTEKWGEFRIIPVIEWQIQDWGPVHGPCPLCQAGSIAIRPKMTDENWKALTTSQL